MIPWQSVTFFFRAEDGIRDADVTGVQTCALPIWTPAGGRTEQGYPSRWRRKWRQRPRLRLPAGRAPARHDQARLPVSHARLPVASAWRTVQGVADYWHRQPGTGQMQRQAVVSYVIPRW